jgi:hypothetical protein
MRLSDLPLKPSRRMLRQFAGLWIVFLNGLAAWHGLAHGETRVALALVVLALTIGPAGLVWPSIIRPVFIGWLILAFPIGWLVSRVVLLIFFSLIIPVALLFRIRGRDALQLRRRTDRTTYWTPKGAPESVRSYLHQF